LPILPHNHPLSRLLLQEAHAAEHGGIESMTMRSRAHAWVVKAKKLAKASSEDASSAGDGRK